MQSSCVALITAHPTLFQPYLRLSNPSSLSSFVKVLSGQLEWSPVHRSERFWRENINNINDRHGEIIKALARLLETAPTYEASA